jgi:hypothetical protein
VVTFRAHNPGRAAALACLGSAGLGAGLLTGCAAQLPARPAAIAVGNQGGSWESVLPGPRVARSELETGGAPGWEYARRDEALSYRPAQALLATDAWPEPPRPSLDEAYYLYIPRQPSVYLYFRSGGYERSGYRTYRGSAWPAY